MNVGVRVRCYQQTVSSLDNGEKPGGYLYHISGFRKDIHP